jgi:hypothetical protein
MSSKPPDTPSSDAPADTLPDTPDDALGDALDDAPEALPDIASITAPDAGPDSAATAKHHDALFKSLFSDPVQAAAQLQAILPPRVARHIDWESLQPVHASFVNDLLEQRHGDLLFSAQLRDERPIFLWLLYEHQSKIERWMSWRTTDMLWEFLKGWRTQHPDATHIPAILPVVLYHGARPWDAPTSLLDLMDLSDEARRDFGDYLLSSRFVLDDLRITADADIDARPLAPQARLGLVLMKHYRDRDLAIFIAAHADDVRRLHATEAGRLWLYRLLSYTWHVNRYTDRDSLVRHLVPLVGPEIEHTMLTYGQRLEQQGVQKGQRTALLRQLTRRFGAVPEPVTARVAAATPADIERWLDRILDATSLDDVFATP